jgi:hypothetical protein
MEHTDQVHRRIVVEYGQWYAYLYITDANGKILEEEAWKQPFRLDVKDVREESHDCFQEIYQWLQDTILWYATARDDDESAESEDTPDSD